MLTTFDQKIAEWFNNIVVDGWPVGNLILVIIALVLSLLLCGILGLEREYRGRSAGLRTHLLVGMGSCIVMIVSIYGFPAQDGVTRDVARLAAQVVSGVGFLGAGAIIYSRMGTKGLTTASTVWLAMALGLACGSMNFILAIASTVLIMFVLLGMRKVEHHIAKTKPTIILVAPADQVVVMPLLKECEKFQCKCKDLVTDPVTFEGKEAIQVTFIATKEHHGEEVDVEAFIDALRLSTHAYSVEVANNHH